MLCHTAGPTALPSPGCILECRVHAGSDGRQERDRKVHICSTNRRDGMGKQACESELSADQLMHTECSADQGVLLLHMRECLGAYILMCRKHAESWTHFVISADRC